MAKDYSQRYSLASGGKQRVAGRRSPKVRPPQWMLKFVGVVVTLAMVSGMATSLFLGWAIRNGLDELSQSKSAFQEYSRLNQNLIAQRDDLSSQERVAAVVEKMGLRSPSPDQLRRP